jgi:hypothetical protein
MPKEAKLPRWLKPVNRVIVALQRLGLAIGTMRLLSIPSRKSGKLRTTPVSPLTVDGQRYIVAGFEWSRLGQECAGGGVGCPRPRSQAGAGDPREATGRGACTHPQGIPTQGAARGPVLSEAVWRNERARDLRAARAVVSRVPGRGGERMT